ncbi:unnamed protein product [Tuber aestivum]|uniref:DSC E3 ubiquitin ligase complex subunit A n=1 Tax=Tuber aestivum TaxID=59557 RepID=A0A292Q6T8_9PEZI|nr:unnamed protein product [Tuber aestivum]
MDQSRAKVLFVLIIIILLAPDGHSPQSSYGLDEIIIREREQLEILRNSTYGVPGNLTGINFTHDRIPPEPVRELVGSLKKEVLGEYFLEGIQAGGLRPPTAVTGETPRGDSGPEAEIVEEGGNAKGSEAPGEGRSLDPTSVFTRLPSIYQNATGTIHGAWDRLFLDVKAPQTNLTYDKNVTANHGKLVFTIEEKKRPGEVQEMTATMVIKNEEGGDMKDISLSGIHFTKSGEILMTTTSDKFAGIFALPHFTLTENAYNQSKALLLDSIATAIKKQKDTALTNSPWQRSPDQAANEKPRCEYIVYFQLHPVQPVLTSHPFLSFNTPYPPYISPETLQHIEKELRHPTGAPVPDAPPIVISGIIYSPSCGHVLSVKKAEGIKIETYFRKAINFALCAAVITCAQILLLIRQMNESNTPSTVSRVSFWTIAMMGIVDGYMALAFLGATVLIDSCYLALSPVTFFSFLLGSIFGMRFLMIIRRIQRPENRPAQSTPPAVTPAVDYSASSLPLPASAMPQAPIILPPNQDINDTGDDGRQDIGTLYPRFLFVLLGSFFVSLHAASWPPLFRGLFVNTVVLLANSYWVPQIYRNVIRGCRKALTWEFVIGMSICRVAPGLYLYCWKGNIFFLEPSYKSAAVVLGWVWFQVFLLLSQQLFGPRVLIPSNLLPPAYDYHPILPIDDLEAAEPQLPSPPPTDATALLPNTRFFDCAICMQSVEVPTISNDRDAGSGPSSVGFLGRRSYMVTPCRHVFHSNCLEGWMRFRLQCPNCRNPLPPL